MPTVQKVIPAQRRGAADMPWFTGDVAGIAARLRAAAADRENGDCVQAVIFIEAIHEAPRLSAPRKAHLTAAVLEAVWLIRGWDAPLAEPAEHPFAALAALAAPPVQSAPVDEAVDEARAPADEDTITARFRRAEAARPGGSCVQAIILIEAIHDRDAPPGEKVRLTGEVLAAVRAVLEWAPW